LARAFVTNPAHIAAFGSSQIAKNEASAACQFAGLEKLRMAPAMIAGLGIGSAVHVASWLSAWAAEDPREPHVHLGPIGVARHARRAELLHVAQIDRLKPSPLPEALRRKTGTPGAGCRRTNRSTA
jgi:hypothetical protein